MVRRSAPSGVDASQNSVEACEDEHFLEASSLGGLLARMPDGFRIDGVIGAAVVLPGRTRLLVFSVSAVKPHEVLRNLGLSITSRSLRPLPPRM
jgi:hypothetical protein